jgi:hypothetical protein
MAHPLLLRCANSGANGVGLELTVCNVLHLPKALTEANGRHCRGFVAVAHVSSCAGFFCVPDEPVGFEPLSNAISDNRAKYRGKSEKWSKKSTVWRTNAVTMRVFGEIPFEK